MTNLKLISLILTILLLFSAVLSCPLSVYADETSISDDSGGSTENGDDTGSGDTGAGTSENSDNTDSQTEEKKTSSQSTSTNWFPTFSLDNYYVDPEPEEGVETRITYVSEEDMPVIEIIDNASLSFSQERITIPYLMQTDLNLYIAEASPSAENITWKSDDSTVLTVDENGIATGVTMGNCWVLASIGTLQKRLYVEVAENTAVKQSSALPYEMWINRSYNNVTIYALDENGEYTIPFKTFRCSGGYSSPYGTQHIQGKYEWNQLGEHWGHYCEWICHGFMLHCNPLMYKYHDNVVDYDMIMQFGTTCSSGCIRIEKVNAKWVFLNLPVGTRVEYYFDIEDPGPLGRNEVIHLPNANCLWEPTDPNPENPWFTGEPNIEGVHDITVSVGENVDFFTDIICTDSLGNLIPENLKITTSLDISTPGTYPVVYALTDAAYKTAYAYCNVIVN